MLSFAVWQTVTILKKNNGGIAMYKFLKNSPILVIILISAAISFTSKAPDGLASLRPPEMAAWLEFGLRPAQTEALLEAEKKRLERALAEQQQLSEAEIKELEKMGAFAARPTLQELEERSEKLSALLKGALDNYEQAHDATVNQLRDLVNRTGNIIKLEAHRSPEEVQKIRQALRPELQTLYDQALKIKDDLEKQQELLKTILADAEEFLQAIPPYPELGDIRGEAREMLDGMHKFYDQASLDKAKFIQIIEKIINKVSG